MINFAKSTCMSEQLRIAMTVIPNTIATASKIEKYHDHSMNV